MHPQVPRKPRKTIHLIGNAHLDPVWLWDRREGLNEGLTTVRTMLDLMDEFEEMTFIRGESAIYQHIEKYDPPTFERVRKMVKAAPRRVSSPWRNRPSGGWAMATRQTH